MTFDKILAKFLLDKKIAINNIIFIIAFIHILMYLILYKYIFMPYQNSTLAVALVLIIFLSVFLFRIYRIKKYLKSLKK
jgi:hypothetical protein